MEIEIIEKYIYELSDTEMYGDCLMLQYSLPLYVYSNSIYELSYFKLIKLNKMEKRQFTLLEYKINLE